MAALASAAGTLSCAFLMTATANRSMFSLANEAGVTFLPTFMRLRGANRLAREGLEVIEKPLVSTRFALGRTRPKQGLDLLVCLTRGVRLGGSRA